MVSSKHFVINDGPNAGVYCSYCGEKLTTKKNEETGEFYYQCDCADARAEILLLTQKEELEAKIAKFYAQREKQIKRMQLLGHRSSIELQLQELASALAELEKEDSATSDEPSRKQIPEWQLEEIEKESLKMAKPKLPNFNQGTL